MLGSKLKELREGKGLMQRQVAAELEVDTAMVSKIENGRKAVSRSYLPVLSELYQFPLDQLQTIWLADNILMRYKDELNLTDALKRLISYMSQKSN